MSSRRNWAAARDSAWRRFGHRHYGWFVYGSIVARAVPFLLGATAVVGVLWGVRWVWMHVPMGTVGLLCALAAVLVGSTWGAWEFFNVTAARKGVTATRILAGGTTLALGAAAVLALAR